MECVFCRILRGELPAQPLHQDAETLAIRDIAPLAPTHILVIARSHISSLNEVTTEEQALLGKMVLTARDLAVREGLAERGYRLAINCGPEGGQAVPHLHLHLLGGRPLANELG